jgi:hypothetical protein
MPLRKNNSARENSKSKLDQVTTICNDPMVQQERFTENEKIILNRVRGSISDYVFEFFN